MEVETERGAITINDTYSTVSEAVQNGYNYAFYSGRLGRDLYKKCEYSHDGKCKQVFAVVTGKDIVLRKL